MGEGRVNIFAHVFLALVFLPMQIFMSEAFRLLLLPYVLYMVFSKNPAFFPALLIYATPGNTISLFLLASCLIVGVFNLNTLRIFKVRNIFISLIVVLPIFLFFLFYGLFVSKIGLSHSLLYLNYYLSFFPFFYGIIISSKFKRDHWRAIVLVCFMLPLIMFIPLPEKISIKLFWLSLPLFIVFLVIQLFGDERKFRVYDVDFGKWGVIFVVLAYFFYELRFTPILCAIISCIILFLYSISKKFLIKFLTAGKIGCVIFLVMLLAINSREEFSINRQIDIGDYEISNFNSLITYLKFKTFDDRAMIWKGGWDFLVSNAHYWPTGSAPAFSFKSAMGAEIDDVEYGIHNIGLELMRNYGIVLGVYLTLIYITIMLKLNIVFRNVKNSFILIFSAVLLGIGIGGGMVGQLVLMSSFSFAFMGLVGLCYSAAFYTNDARDLLLK